MQIAKCLPPRLLCSKCKHKTLSKTLTKSEFAFGCSHGNPGEEEEKE
jgi:hypothetical protein